MRRTAFCRYRSCRPMCGVRASCVYTGNNSFYHRAQSMQRIAVVVEALWRVAVPLLCIKVCSYIIATGILSTLESTKETLSFSPFSTTRYESSAKSVSAKKRRNESPMNWHYPHTWSIHTVEWSAAAASSSSQQPWLGVDNLPTDDGDCCLTRWNDDATRFLHCCLNEQKHALYSSTAKSPHLLEETDAATRQGKRRKRLKSFNTINDDNDNYSDSGENYVRLFWMPPTNNSAASSSSPSIGIVPEAAAVAASPQTKNSVVDGQEQSEKEASKDDAATTSTTNEESGIDSSASLEATLKTPHTPTLPKDADAEEEEFDARMALATPQPKSTTLLRRLCVTVHLAEEWSATVIVVGCDTQEMDARNRNINNNIACNDDDDDTSMDDTDIHSSINKSASKECTPAAAAAGQSGFIPSFCLARGLKRSYEIIFSWMSTVQSKTMAIAAETKKTIRCVPQYPNHDDDDDGSFFWVDLKPITLTSTEMARTVEAWLRVPGEEETKSIEKSSLVQKGRKLSYSAGGGGATTAYSKMNKPLILTFAVPVKGLETLSLTVPPEWTALLSQHLKNHSSNTNNIGRSNKNERSRQPQCPSSRAVGLTTDADSVPTVTPNSTSLPPKTILEALQAFLADSFCIDTTTFPLVQVESAVATLGCDGRFKPKTPAALASILDIVSAIPPATKINTV